MLRVTWRVCALGLVIGSLTCSGVARAQETPPPAGPPGGPPPEAPGQPPARGGISDPELIGWLIVDNQAEIEISRIGEQQASNPEVQQFSRQMIQDHTRMLQTLQRALGGPQAGAPGQPPDARGGSPIPPEVLDRNPLIGLYAQLGQRVVDSAAQMLQQYRGAQFDREYMQLQTALHMRQLDTLDLFSRHASPQLQPTLRQSTQTVRQHLEHARDMLARIETGANAEAGQQRRVGQAPQQPGYSAEYGSAQGGAWGSAPTQGQWGTPGGTVYGGRTYGGATYGGSYGGGMYRGTMYGGTVYGGGATPHYGAYGYPAYGTYGGYGGACH